jgi:hypothetical protein
MSQRDRYHDAVKRALVKDGWNVTHDPYTLSRGRRNLYVDLGAERLLAAERPGEKIAVEIYRSALRRQDPSRRMVVAVPFDAFESIWSEEVAQDVARDEQIPLLVFDPVEEVIRRWLP